MSSPRDTASFRSISPSLAALLLALLAALAPLRAAEKVRVYPLGEEDPDAKVGEPVTRTVDVESGPVFDANGMQVFDGFGEFVSLDAGGGPVYAEGRQGAGSLAVEFDGVDDTLTSGAFDPRDFRSFAALSQAWVKPDSAKRGQAQSVWSLGSDNGGVGISADGHWGLIAVSAVPDTVSTAAVAFDSWTHVAVLRGGNGAELYIDGALVLSGSGFWHGVGGVTVGHRSSAAGAPTFFQGIVDDFNISGFSDGSFDAAEDIDAVDPDAFSGVPGDVDQDGVVDGDDYVIWSMNVGFDNQLGAGDGPSLLLGDVDQNGRINYFDFQIISDLAGVQPPPDDPGEPAGVAVADDFVYRQPTKELGPGGGFLLQDYAGGQNGSAGSWGGRWVSVGNSIITGTDFDRNGIAFPCADVEPGAEPPLLELDPADQQFKAYTDTGLSDNYMQRAFTLAELPLDEVYFAARVMVLEGNTPIGRLLINSPEVEEFAIGVAFEPGLGFSATLGFVSQFSVDSTIDPGVFHLLVGRLEVNAEAGSEVLTVWLDPTGEEEAEEEIQVIGEVLDSLEDLTGVLRLDRGTTGCGPIFWDDVAIGTSWDSVVRVDVPRLDLLVDEVSGTVRLANNTGRHFDLDFLQLSSASGSLNPDGWNGLAGRMPEGAGWQRNHPGPELLTESSFAGATRLAAGTTLELGAAFTPGATQDIVARVGTRQGLLNVAPLSRAGESNFLRGDATGDGTIDLSDPVANLSFQFLGSFDPPCKDALDFDDSGVLDLSDPVANLTHQFVGGLPPAAPGKEICGPDPSGDDLSCDRFPACP